MGRTRRSWRKRCRGRTRRSTHHGADGDVVLLDLFEVELSTAAVLDDGTAGSVLIDDECAVFVGLLLRAVHDVVVDSGFARRARPGGGGGGNIMSYIHTYKHHACIIYT